MQEKTQQRILKLSAECSTVHSIAVFRSRHWSDPEEGIFLSSSRPPFQLTCDLIQQCVAVMLALNLENIDARVWTLKGTVKSVAYVSGEQHTCWVFYRG